MFIRKLKSINLLKKERKIKNLYTYIYFFYLGIKQFFILLAFLYELELNFVFIKVVLCLAF